MYLSTVDDVYQRRMGIPKHPSKKSHIEVIVDDLKKCREAITRIELVLVVALRFWPCQVALASLSSQHMGRPPPPKKSGAPFIRLTGCRA